MRNSLAGTKVSEEGGGEVLQARSRSPLQLVVSTMVKQTVPLQPMEYHGGAGFHAAACGGAPGGAGGCGLEEAVACGGPPLEQTPDQTCSLWREAHAGAGDLAGAAAHGGPRLVQFALEGWTPWYGPMLEQFLKSCCLWEAHAGSVREGRHPMGGTPCGAGSENDREGVAEMKH